VSDDLAGVELNSSATPEQRARFDRRPEAIGAASDWQHYHSTEMFIDDLRSRRREILSIAARHGANDVRVFGSVLRGDDAPDSDLDLLVDVEEGRSLLDIIGLEQELGALLGRRVEVLTVGGLSPYLEQQILAEAARL
jgi:predicted nucleotidyltransferase